ncbi:MAPEG family protein [Pokkaliibacter sp. MBI-7]|uniref:MAPEG family protein n=1 Tax=Pokkaliibacter sp. MBI-7 TaxID=3040600 RepID=UPI00244CDD23|nr:MAPEG family protein [Pokkaliibacter sp. MBI-7]MDH2432606.1 MAPEG family protein [Pokkaliibacter sp. MBI-7]
MNWQCGLIAEPLLSRGAMMTIGLYAGLLGLIYIFLSYRVIAGRRHYRVALGDNHIAPLQRCIRVHGNFMEYVPFALILLLLLELNGMPPLLLHLLGGLLVLGRVLHAYGVNAEQENLRFRISGMVATINVLLVASLVLIGSALG